MNHVLFHSRAKCNVGKFLSNFHPCKIQINDEEFNSCENAFQATKFTLTNKPEYFEKLIHVSAVKAKQMGSKGGMKKLGAVLDQNKWNEIKDEVDLNLIQFIL